MKPRRGFVVVLVCVALVAVFKTLRHAQTQGGPATRPTDDPVVRVERNDPEMRVAVRQARRKWPQFAAAFERRQSGEHFSAKAPFREGGREEYMWVTVTKIEHETVYGILDNDPVDVTSLKAGQPVHFPLSELNDWLYEYGDVVHGGFTIAVLTKEKDKRLIGLGSTW